MRNVYWYCSALSITVSARAEPPQVSFCRLCTFLQACSAPALTPRLPNTRYKYREHNVARRLDSDRMTSTASACFPALCVLVSSLPALPRCCLRDAESPTPATQAKMLPGTKSCLHGIRVLRSLRATMCIGEFIPADHIRGSPTWCPETRTTTVGFLQARSTTTSSQLSPRTLRRAAIPTKFWPLYPSRLSRVTCAPSNPRLSR